MWKHESAPSAAGLDTLSVWQLEEGLRSLEESGFVVSFFNENVVAFRETIILAIRETSDALSQPRLSEGWRVELTEQVEALRRYADLADRYIAMQARLARLN